jgi:protoporphyrinogen oxidase
MGLGRRGLACRVVDPRPVAGGMACTRDRGGLRYKAGIHLLHASAPGLRPLAGELVGLMQPDAHAVRPRAAVRFLDRSVEFPFRPEGLLDTLGPGGTARAAFSALATRAGMDLRRVAGRAEADSFEAVVRRAYGDRFYRLFFRDYTAKVLGVDPAGISGDWARRRVPMPTGRNVLRVLLPWWRLVRLEHAHESFDTRQHTGHDGMDSLFRGLLRAARGRASLEPGRSLRRVEVAHGAVRAVTLAGPGGAEETLAGVPLVSTIPLTELVALLDPPPPEAVRRASARLRFRGLAFVFVVARGGRLMDHDWTYFQERSVPFNRVSEFGNLVPGLYGPGRTVACAEITADPGEAAWDGPDDAVVRRTVDGLSRVLGRPFADRIEDAFVERERFAYPNWTLGYRADADAVLAYLDGIRGLHSAGRQGRFAYLNMDESIASGLEAAARVVADGA